jgi:hypothetical protein
MGEKYTAVWNDRWMSGSHWHSITKIFRFELEENEDMLHALDRIGLVDAITVLFEGWPRMQGEEDKDIVATKTLEDRIKS